LLPDGRLIRVVVEVLSLGADELTALADIAKRTTSIFRR